MKYFENECTPQGTFVYRGVVTSRYKKYRGPVLVGLRGISEGLVTGNLMNFKRFRETQIGIALKFHLFNYPFD